MLYPRSTLTSAGVSRRGTRKCLGALEDFLCISSAVAANLDGEPRVGHTNHRLRRSNREGTLGARRVHLRRPPGSLALDGPCGCRGRDTLRDHRDASALETLGVVASRVPGGGRHISLSDRLDARDPHRRKRRHFTRSRAHRSHLFAPLSRGQLVLLRQIPMTPCQVPLVLAPRPMARSGTLAGAPSWRGSRSTPASGSTSTTGRDSPGSAATPSGRPSRSSGRDGGRRGKRPRLGRRRGRRAGLAGGAGGASRWSPGVGFRTLRHHLRPHLRVGREDPVVAHPVDPRRWDERRELREQLVRREQEQERAAPRALHPVDEPTSPPPTRRRCARSAGSTPGARRRRCASRPRAASA